MAARERVQLLRTDRVPAPTAPYSHALLVESGRLLFVAGQGPLDAVGRVVGAGDVRAQARQVFTNIQALVEAAGGTLADIVELTIYLRDIAHRSVVTDVRRELLREPYPATTMVEISRLAFDDWLIEISALAAV